MKHDPKERAKKLSGHLEGVLRQLFWTGYAGRQGIMYIGITHRICRKDMPLTLRL